jgi:hypothetical protein
MRPLSDRPVPSCVSSMNHRPRFGDAEEFVEPPRRGSRRDFVLGWLTFNSPVSDLVSGTAEPPRRCYPTNADLTGFHPGSLKPHIRAAVADLQRIAVLGGRPGREACHSPLTGSQHGSSSWSGGIRLPSPNRPPAHPPSGPDVASRAARKRSGTARLAAPDERRRTEVVGSGTCNTGPYKYINGKRPSHRPINGILSSRARSPQWNDSVCTTPAQTHTQIEGLIPGQRDTATRAEGCTSGPLQKPHSAGQWPEVASAAGDPLYLSGGPLRPLRSGF